MPILYHWLIAWTAALSTHRLTMRKLDEFQRHSRTLANFVSENLPTRRCLKRLLNDWQELSDGERERFERDLHLLNVTFEELRQLLAERLADA